MKIEHKLIIIEMS